MNSALVAETVSQPIAEGISIETGRLQTRLVRCLVFAILLYPSLQSWQWSGWMLTLLVIALLPKHRWLILGIASPILFLTKNIIELHLLPGLIAAFSSYLMAFFCLQMPQRSWVGKALPFALFFLLMATFDQLKAVTPHSTFLLQTASEFKIFLWPLVATAYFPQIRSRFSSFQILNLLVPFWSVTTVMLIPVSPSFLLPTEVQNDAEFDRCQQKALSLLSAIVIAAILLVAFDYAAFGLSMSNPLSFANVSWTLLDSLFSRFLIWHSGWPAHLALPIAALAGGIHIILCFVIMMNVFVACARMAGFDLLAATHRPYEASDFNNFMGRILYYYNQILLKIFFPMFKKSVPKVIAVRARLSIGIFLTVCMGGWFFHFIRDLAEGMSEGRTLLEFFKFYLVQAMPYYVLIGLASCVSAVLHDKREPHGRWSHVLRLTWYFSAYSFIYAFYLLAWHERRSWSEVANLWSLLK